MHLEMSVSKILAHWRLKVLQNYQSFIEMFSNMIYTVALAIGLKCWHKIHLNTQCPPPPTHIWTDLEAKPYYMLD